MKYKIERNTVQETLILPLYSRKLCSELYPNLYRDETAVRLIDQIDYNFSVAEKNSRSLMQRFGALEVAMRQCDLAWEVRDYLKTHPCAAVVNLGCGLDNTGRACDNGRCKIYNLDFPDVIALRQQLLPAGEREQNIPCDLKDPAWFDKIDASGGAVFFASGVFYYFLTQQVRELVQGMADAFPGGVLVFDAANRTAVKMIAKTWLKTAKIKDVGAYFAVSDAKSELSPWDSRLQVSSRGYMLGYSDLKDPSVNGFFRFLAKVGDGMMKMQIVKIRFSGRHDHLLYLERKSGVPPGLGYESGGMRCLSGKCVVRYPGTFLRQTAGGAGGNRNFDHAALQDAAGSGYYLSGLLGRYDGAGTGKGESTAPEKCNLSAGECRYASLYRR